LFLVFEEVIGPIFLWQILRLRRPTDHKPNLL
jgi:hypothetical protein